MARPDVEAGDLVRVMDNAGNAYVIPLVDMSLIVTVYFTGP